MTITEEEFKRIEQVMSDARKALKSAHQREAVLVKMLLQEKHLHDALKTWVRGFQS